MPNATLTPAALRRPERIPLNEKVAWSLDDAAAATSTSRSTIKKLIREGLLVPSRITGRPLLDPRHVQQVFFPDAETEGGE